MTRLLVVSEVCLYLEGLARLVTQALTGATVLAARTPGEALERITREPVDVVLVDLAMSDALRTARMIGTRFPDVRTVGLGVGDEHAQVVACAEAGILGFVSRSGSTTDLIDAIRCATSRERMGSHGIAAALAARVATLARPSSEPSSARSLTRRELEVVQLVDEGLTNKEIARRLHLSTATVRNHVHNILDRLGARTRTQAAALVRRATTRG